MNGTIRAPLTEVIFEIGGFCEGYTTYSIVFHENGASMTITHFDETREIVYDAQSASDWRRAFDALSTQRWRSSYNDSFICDGEQWSLVVKREGKRTRHFDWSNDYPPRWYQLTALFGIWEQEPYDDEEITTDPAPLPSVTKLCLSFESKGESVVRSESITVSREDGAFEWSRSDESGKEYSSSWKDDPQNVYSALWAAQHCLASSGWNDSEANASHRYRLAATYDDGEQSTREGAYYRDALLNDAWKILLRELRRLRDKTSRSAMLDSDAFAFTEPDRNVTYCSVSFDESKFSLYYISEMPDLNIGDRVIVPYGQENKERIGVITKIERLDAGEAPFPLYRTKKIIGKIEPARE